MGISNAACAKRSTVAAALTLSRWLLIKLSLSRSSLSSMPSRRRDLQKNNLTCNPYLATATPTTKSSVLASALTAPSAFAASSTRCLRAWWGSASPCISTMTVSSASSVRPQCWSYPVCTCQGTRRSGVPVASTIVMSLIACAASPEPSCTVSGSRSCCPMMSGEPCGSR